MVGERRAVERAGRSMDSLVNRGEYFSNHYLGALIHNDLAGLRKQWDQAERGGGGDGRGEATARTRVRALARDFFAAKARVAEGVSGDHAADLRAMHDTVLTALGFTGPDGTPERRELQLVRGGVEEITVPAAHAVRTHTGLLLVALDLGFATSVDNALDPDEAGALLAPVTLDNGKRRVRDLGDATAAVFAADDPPRYLLLLAGGVIILADRGKWAEGRFLAADLDLALSRRDTRSRGELETIAALFSADALVPTDDRSVLETLTEASQKHAVGVSKDLREGIRRSVEILAGEVIAQRLANKQRVYDQPGLAEALTKQCLRFLYRLLFLLYAEARPELGILPVDAPEYTEGYGLDRLRDLALVDLTTDRARNGRHLHDSLKLLFRLVNDGYHHQHAEQTLDATTDDTGLRFEPLRSELFAPKATELLDRHPLRNEALQQVLRLLLLSKERRGHDRGFVSYAQLGVNQLGAVYEGLMAYTGFFADTDQFEVARPGQEDKGTWMVPAHRADDYDDRFFVTRPNPDTGLPERVLHRRGSFVYRLSGRERQRSASYYTPEILTRTVVKHALAELLDQDGQRTPASRLLELTICEPALGSGAFLNEAINQLAEEYLRRREDETGRRVDPDTRQHELQKVKAHIALHQCYGVDLNHTAVELAEVSLWLNAMHRGLQAPWFGLHLRRGNSLVGARRATYRRDQLAKRAWLKAAPKDRKLSEGPIGPEEIHHFLLPADGWASVVTARQARELRPDNVKQLKAWKTAVTRAPSDSDARRLVALSRRVEELWELARQRLELAEAGLRRQIQVWEAPNDSGNGNGNGGRARATEGRAREQIQAALEDRNTALGRLRLAMDAWCALWFWPIDDVGGMPQPPTMVEWIKTLEDLLGVKVGVNGEDAPGGQLDMLSELESLEEQERRLVDRLGMLPTLEVIQKHDWLLKAIGIADREGFWHWELEFAHIFGRGGFDLQVGNPPWVRPRWADDIVLAEAEPWFGLTERIPVEEFTERRAIVLDQGHESTYLRELSSEGGMEIIGSPVMRPLLTGIQTNLYMVFMDTAWRNLAHRGIAGLLHPESHFNDPKAGPLREATYRHLRRHFQFLNELQLFEDIHHMTGFGIHIYGREQPISFTQLVHLLHPDIIDGSLEHDGYGELPGIQYPWGGWDLRSHRARVVNVDDEVLASWARLFDEPGTPAGEARLLRPVTIADLEALRVLAEQTGRMSDRGYRWTSGFHERGRRPMGSSAGRPRSLVHGMR